MRYHLILLAALLAPATQATAQVTVDLGALEALPGTGAAAPAPHRPSARRHKPAEATRKPAPHPAVAATKPAEAAPVATTARPATPPAATAPAPAKTTAAAASLPSMDAAPPAVAQLKPAEPAVASPSSPPQSAASTAAAAPTAVQIGFPAGKADLGPDSAGTIKQLIAAGHADAGATYNVVAYAAGTPGDPSVARRLSLSRALAVRKALMADGVDSSHIYVRAMGSSVPSGPADRVDLTLLGGNNPTR